MLKDVSILGLARILPIGLALVQSIAVARILGPEGFGALAVIAAYPALVFGILNARTAEVTTRFLADFDARGLPDKALGLCKVAYAIDLVVAGAAVVVVAATAGVVAPHVLDDLRLAPLMTVFAVSFLPNALTPTSTAVLAVSNRFPLTASIEAGAATLRTAMVVGFVLAGFGVPGVVYGLVLGNTVLGMAITAAAHRVAVRRWHRSWFRSRWTELAGRRREIARFFVLSDLTALCNTAIKNVDVLILGAFRPVSEVGFYNLGKSLTTQLLVVVSAVRAVAFPRIMRMWTTGDWESLWSTVRSHTWRLAAPGTVAVGALMLAVVPAIELVYGSDYTPAAPVARLLLLQVVMLLLTLWVDMVFLAWGHLRVLLLARALGAVIVTVGTVLLAPRWGGAAAASMLLLQQAVSAVITFTWMYRHRGTHRAEAQRRASVHAGGRS